MNQTLDRLYDLLPEAAQKNIREESESRRVLSEQVRQECLQAIADLSMAARWPGSARLDLEAAQKHLMKALSISCVLDPEE
jgi:hypothetical protein